MRYKIFQTKRYAHLRNIQIIRIKITRRSLKGKDKFIDHIYDILNKRNVTVYKNEFEEMERIRTQTQKEQEGEKIQDVVE